MKKWIALCTALLVCCIMLGLMMACEKCKEINGEGDGCDDDVGAVILFARRPIPWPPDTVAKMNPITQRPIPWPPDTVVHGAMMVFNQETIQVDIEFEPMQQNLEFVELIIPTMQDGKAGALHMGLLSRGRPIPWPPDTVGPFGITSVGETVQDMDMIMKYTKK